MSRIAPPRVALVSAALALAPLARADSLRCDGGIVSSGDTTVELLAKCGRPALVESRLDERGELTAGGEDRPPAGVRVVRQVETWTYDFGPSRFIQVVRLEDGRVAGVARGGHGVAESSTRATIPRARCEPASIDEGDRAYELLATCGEPAARSRRREEGLVTAGEGAAQLVAHEIEVWTFDFGPTRFIRVVELVDGVVTRVETGGHGHSGAPGR